jgi:Fanconi anemia group M protein
MDNTEIILVFFFPSGDKNKDFFYSHPKLKKLEEVVVEHFKSWNGK